MLLSPRELQASVIEEHYTLVGDGIHGDLKENREFQLLVSQCLTSSRGARGRVKVKSCDGQGNFEIQEANHGCQQRDVERRGNEASMTWMSRERGWESRIPVQVRGEMDSAKAFSRASLSLFPAAAPPEQGHGDQPCFCLEGWVMSRNHRLRRV